VEPYVLSADVVNLLSEAIISPAATNEDMARWFSQGCEFARAPCPNYMLRQSHGGPCGVLAALQAEILKCLYFKADNPRLPVEDQGLVSSVNAEEAERLFLTAIWRVLKRASERDFVVFVSACILVVFRKLLMIVTMIIFVGLLRRVRCRSIVVA
jgi:hypothetical protein